MNERQQAISEAIWKTIVLAYGGVGHEGYQSLPAREVVSALLTCTANMVAQVPDAKERQKIMRQIPPALDRAVTQARQRSNLILPPSGIEIPH